MQPGAGCTGFDNDGPDAVFALTLPAGKMVTATVTPTGWDAAVEIIQPCALTPTCLAGKDVGFSGDAETATYSTTASMTLFVVVDSYLATAKGPYALTIRVQ